MFRRSINQIKDSLLGKNKSKGFKHFLKVYQENEKIILSGVLNNPVYKVKQLNFKSRFSDQVYSVKSEILSNEFEFKIDLYEHPELYQEEHNIFDLYLLINVVEESLSNEKIEQLKKKAEERIDSKGIRYFEYQIRLGRFQQTDISRTDIVKINDKSCTLYKTTKGNLSFAVNHKLKPNTKTQINYMKMYKGRLKLDGKVFTKNSIIDKSSIVFKSRDSGREIVFPVRFEHLTEETKKKYGLNRYRYTIEVDLNRVFSADIDQDIYDVFFEFDYHDCEQSVRVRVGHPRFRARVNIKSTFVHQNGKKLALSPYYTIKYRNLSVQVDLFDSEVYQYLTKMMKWSWVIRPFYRHKDIWVVGERPYKAQDTGFHFFKYMRENHPDKNVFYVIEEDSPELRNVKELGNILFYKSKRHIFHVLMASRIIGSHHPDYLYPLRTNEFKRKVKGLKVFIQHGVIGTKNIVHFYGKTSPSFQTDLFLVSSDLEKSIIVNDLGYNPEQVQVTGLSRFDSLFKKDITPKRQLLIIPTWREWLVNEEKFLESEYFKRYKSLINNTGLHALAEKYKFEIVFCLHPNMQQFSHFFKDSPVKIITQGEIDVQILLKESAIMITDYSSVAFDFSFLHKPILYYQFDRERFIGKKGSHINLDEDLPGDIVYSEIEILEGVKNYAENNFLMKEENIKKAQRFIKYKDLNSSERIFKAVRNARKESILDRGTKKEIVKVLFKRFRKSKYYFPTMKVFYSIAKKILPVDEKLIIFESGIGKQYSDSPKMIYEEILERELDYKKVWICNKNIKFRDSNTIRVKRLSPKYYYYLAKAKYWINNQNFPTYIKKRPETIYLQTWHGTPLKKMLYDIEKVHGRSDDYVERVGNAVKNWDYLISPSEYATKAFRSAFRYSGEIWELGYPRNDIFYWKEDKKEKIINKVKSQLRLPNDKKIILYAPTFRDDQTSNNNKFLFDINMDLHKMKEELGDDYILLLRMHVVISNKIQVDESLKDFVKNVSNYSDIQELLLISDVLITDYSSVMFDFANTGRPIIFYTYDLENYRDNLRGFYMDFENEVPGPFAFNTSDIIQNILNIDKVTKRYCQKYKEFQAKFCSLEDGNASKRVVDRLFK